MVLVTFARKKREKEKKKGSGKSGERAVLFYAFFSQ